MHDWFDYEEFQKTSPNKKEKTFKSYVCICTYIPTCIYLDYVGILIGKRRALAASHFQVFNLPFVSLPPNQPFNIILKFLLPLSLTSLSSPRISLEKRLHSSSMSSTCMSLQGVVLHAAMLDSTTEIMSHSSFRRPTSRLRQWGRSIKSESTPAWKVFRHWLWMQNSIPLERLISFEFGTGFWCFLPPCFGLYLHCRSCLYSETVTSNRLADSTSEAITASRSWICWWNASNIW